MHECLRRILVLYYHPHAGPMRTAVHRHLHAIERSRRPHRMLYYNVAHGAPAWLRHAKFDAVILHTTFLTLRWAARFGEHKWALRWVGDLDCTKIAIPQDEYDHSEVLDEWLYEWNVRIIFSNFDAARRKLLYPIMGDKATFYECFTGYIDEEDALRMQATLVPSTARPKDLVYRAAHLPYWFGSHGQLKHGIAAVAARRASAFGLSCDISTRVQDTIVGPEWLDFLASGRAVLGCESGSSVLDRKGEVREQILTLNRMAADAPFEAVSSRMPEGWDSYDFFAVSPRHFEAVITKTCQVLIDGYYNGVLEPFRHYIPLTRDLSNLDEVLGQLGDRELIGRVADQAYQDIYASRRYSYIKFAEAIEEAIDFGTEARGGQSKNRTRVWGDLIWKAGQASAQMTNQTLRWRQRTAQRMAASPAFWRAVLHPLVGLVKGALAVKLILNSRAKRTILACALRLERNHKTVGFGSILLDLLMWSLLEEVRAGRSQLVPDINGEVIVKVLQGELLFQSRRGGAATASVTSAPRHHAGRCWAETGRQGPSRIVWDNSAVGDQILCPVTSSKRVTFFVGHDGVHEFTALAQLAQYCPKEVSECCFRALSIQTEQTTAA